MRAAFGPRSGLFNIPLQAEKNDSPSLIQRLCAAFAVFGCMMRPFFSFYGAKWRVANYYPQPTYPTIIEAFAGSAGYSLRHPDRMVKLYDVDDAICAVWDYLIHVRPEEILALPLLFDHVDEIDAPQEARSMIGYWLNKGTVQPSKSPSKWMQDYRIKQPGVYWGEKIRERIASQVGCIRHWTITQSTYANIPNQLATWFVDPPYEVAGRAYRHHDIDYTHLASWCMSRNGQAIACENAGADWLPFKPFRVVKGLEGKRGGKRSVEVVWTHDEGPTPTADPVGVWQPSSSSTDALSL